MIPSTAIRRRQLVAASVLESQWSEATSVGWNMPRAQPGLTPLDEARSGHLGEATARLVRDAARKVLSRNRDEADELAQAFFADPKVRERIQKAAAVAADDDRYGALIYRTVRNFQVSEFRKTPRGKRQRSYADALRNSEEVETIQSGGVIVAYRRVGDSGGTYDGPLAPLVDALRAEPPPQPASWSSEKRDAPPAAPGETERLTLALLDAAGGPVTKQQLFNGLDQVMQPVPVEISLDDALVAGGEAVARAEVGEDAVAAVYGELSGVQRRILAALIDTDGAIREMTARKAEDALGIPKSTADRAIKALRRLLEDCERNGHDRGAMLRELVACAQDGDPSGGTTTDGSSS